MAKVLTSQPRKQRLLRLTAPHHQARKQMASHLSEELLLRFNRRSMTVVKGDEVRLVRGDHKGKQGKVVGIDATKRKVTIDGITHKKADGTEVALPVDPSNLTIVKLNLEDKRRQAKLDSSAETGKARDPNARAKKAPARKGKAEKATKADKTEKGDKAEKGDKEANQ